MVWRFFSKAVLLPFLLFVACNRAPEGFEPPVLFPDSLAQYISALTTDANQFLAELNKVSDSIDSNIDAIVDYIYCKRKMEFDSVIGNIDNMLPQRVWKRGRGGCIGVGLIFLLIAERKGMPIYGVLLPGHFFVRYDDGTNKINIEPNRRGYNHDDEYYRMRYSVGVDDSFYSLRNLTKREVAAVLAYNLGTINLAQGKNWEAAKLSRDAAYNFVGFAEAYGNLAIANIALGKDKEALAAFRMAEKERPHLKNLSYNIGMFYLNRGFTDSALIEFEKVKAILK